MGKRYEPLDPKGLRTYSLRQRASKVRLAHLGRAWKPGGNLADFLSSFPQVVAGQDLGALVGANTDERKGGARRPARTLVRQESLG